MTQIDIPFAAKSETSREAARSMQGRAVETCQQRVLAFVRNRGNHGATCDEIEAALGMRHQNASARVNCLSGARGGWLLRKAGRKRITRSGRNAEVYIYNALGRER